MKKVQYFPSGDPLGLRLVASVMAHFVRDGTIGFSHASAILARALIRNGLIDEERDIAEFQSLLERFDRALGMALVEIETEATAAIRAVLRICIQRGAEPVIVQEAAYSVNVQHGHALPDRCVRYLINEALACPAQQLAGAA